MAGGPANGVIRHLQRAVHRDGAGLTDVQLLRDYVHRRDGAALSALVHRHGPMVWGVCRRVLGTLPDAEDAFQATFLVLVRRASSIAQPELVASWLYGVAHQTALKARSTLARRRARERRVADMPEPAAIERNRWTDLQPLLDEELSRLSRNSRAVIVLCDLEGKTRAETARQLGVAEGTVASRLARARAQLANRLSRRGVTISGGVLAATLVRVAAPAAVPGAVLENTIRVAGLFAAGPTAAAAHVSPAVLDLANQILGGSIMKLKLLGVCLFATAALAAGLGLGLAGERPPASPAPAQPEPPAASARDEPDAPWQDLLATIDPDKHTIGQGIWRLKEGKLTGYPAAHGAVLRVPVVPRGNYELRARWQPKNSGSHVSFVLTHGDDRRASVEIMTPWDCAGLGDLNGVRPDINETRRAVKVKPGVAHDVAIRVVVEGPTIEVVATLDREEIVNWTGKRSEVEHEYLAPPKPVSLGLAVAGDSSIFHQLQLRMLSGKSERWEPDGVKRND
jgi:RNA polymerase sigma factor (sigma-70 family)